MSTDNAAVITHIGPPRGAMPSPVRIALVITALFVLLSAVVNVVMHQGSMVHAAVGILILIGLAKGHALAWQWGRVIPVLLAIFVGLALFGMMAKHVPLVTILMFIVPMALFSSVPFLLSTEDARVFFGLKCPSCQHVRGKAANFFFTQYRCADCGTTWTR